MSVKEDWTKPFPVLRPISYLITDNEYFSDLTIELYAIEKSLWTIKWKRGFLRKSDFLFCNLSYISIYSHLEEFTFTSLQLAGEFYQNNLDRINKQSPAHPKHTPRKIQLQKLAYDLLECEIQDHNLSFMRSIEKEI